MILKKGDSTTLTRAFVFIDLCSFIHELNENDKMMYNLRSKSVIIIIFFYISEWSTGIMPTMKIRQIIIHHRRG